MVKMLYKNKKSKKKVKSFEEVLLKYEEEFSFLKQNLKKILDSDFKSLKENVDEETFKEKKQEFIDSTINEYFKKIRMFLIETLKLKKGFTYEEAYKKVSRKHISEELKNQFKSLILKLNEIEYSPVKDYEKLYDILDELLIITKEIVVLEEQKKVEKDKFKVLKQNLKKTFLLIKKVTFIFWFPFYFLYLKLKVLFEKEESSVLKVKSLVEKGELFLKKNNLYEAIKMYDVIRKEYSYLDDDDKLLLKPKILQFYNDILQTYEELKKLEEKDK